MHYAMAFRQIAAANALEVLGADVLQENRRGETTTAVAKFASLRTRVAWL